MKAKYPFYSIKFGTTRLIIAEIAFEVFIIKSIFILVPNFRKQVKLTKLRFNNSMKYHMVKA